MIDLIKDVYNGTKVLVTGHTGFKGAWLSLWLRRLGANVVGYSLDPPSTPNLFDAISLSKKITHIYGDICDIDRLINTFREHKPQFVFHLAAQALVRQSFAEPHRTYETNVMGTVNVLEAVRGTDSVRVVINVTSDKCYENKEWIWGYRETDPMGGKDPYSSSKGCAELVTSAYLHSFFDPAKYGANHKIALGSVRAGNVIGGGDWGKDRLIPDCIRALSAGEKIVIRYPEAIRPWQYVLEPLRGYLFLGSKLWTQGAKFIGGWNFGPINNQYLTVAEIAEMIIKLWGGAEDYYLDSREQPSEVQMLRLDCSKARFELGHSPALKVSQALEATVNWYKKFYKNTSSRELEQFSLEMLSKYEDICMNPKR